MAKKKRFDTTEIRLTDEELALRMENRYRVRRTELRRRRAIMLAVFLVVFALLATMCGKDIVRLKSENIALKKQQAELEKQRDALKEELKNVNDPQYIREQARKQLRLLNPGEILFTFEDEEEPEETEDAEPSENKEQTEESGGGDG